MRVTQYGINYALHIITTHFGDLVAKVCGCLLHKGPLTLQNIVEYTQLSKSQVKNSLLVLIQHNCVQAFILKEADSQIDTPKTRTQYMVLFDNILHRMRFAKFLDIVHRELGQPCFNLLEGLLQHGRLTMKQISDRANQENKMDMDLVNENLHKLAAARYIEHCPVAEPVIAPPTEEEASAKKRSAKSAKMIESLTLEQRILEAAIPIDAQRFSIEADMEMDTNKENDKNKSPISHGKKRKHIVWEDDIVDGSTDQQLTLWRVNFEELVRRLRHKACVERARAMMDDGTAIVLSAMLDASRNDERKVKTDVSVPLSVNCIYEEVIKSEKGRNMTFDRVRDSLVQLISTQFIKAVDDLYCIDFKHIIKSTQSSEVESTVSRRFGNDAYKMFRLLSNAGCLMETDKIADTAFVEKKEAGKILYRMWQDEYLIMEKVVAGSTQFLLWKVNENNLYEHVLDDMFHASLNLCHRLDYELEQQKEVINLPREKREGNLGDKYQRITRVRILLESSRMKVDDGLMLFYDF